MSNPSVLEEVRKTHDSTDNVMKDFCDVEFWKTHSVFKKYTGALQFILYYDDIEVSNPLGAKAGMHKLGTHNHVCAVV